MIRKNIFFVGSAQNTFPFAFKVEVQAISTVLANSITTSIIDIIHEELYDRTVDKKVFRLKH